MTKLFVEQPRPTCRSDKIYTLAWQACPDGPIQQPPGHVNYFPQNSPLFPVASPANLSLNNTALMYGKATGMWYGRIRDRAPERWEQWERVPSRYEIWAAIFG